ASARMRRVVETSSPTRNSVVTTSSVGNDENPNGFRLNSDAIKSATATAMFSASIPSSNGRGTGTINITTTAITSAAIASSAARMPFNSDLLDLGWIQLDRVVLHVLLRP